MGSEVQLSGALGESSCFFTRGLEVVWESSGCEGVGLKLFTGFRGSQDFRS